MYGPMTPEETVPGTSYITSMARLVSNEAPSRWLASPRRWEPAAGGGKQWNRAESAGPFTQLEDGRRWLSFQTLSGRKVPRYGRPPGKSGSTERKSVGQLERGVIWLAEVRPAFVHRRALSFYADAGAHMVEAGVQATKIACGAVTKFR